MSKAFFISLLILVLPLTVLAGATDLDNPLAGINNLLQGPGYIGGVISRVLGIIGALALLMLIYGGLSIILAAGNDTKIAQGKNIVTYTAVGLIVIFMSYTAITFFLNTLGGTIQDEYQDLPLSPAAQDESENTTNQAGPLIGPDQDPSCPVGCVISDPCIGINQPADCINTPGCCGL